MNSITTETTTATTEELTTANTIRTEKERRGTGG
jgi:hypothetical protein